MFSFLFTLLLRTKGHNTHASEDKNSRQRANNSNQHWLSVLPEPAAALLQSLLECKFSGPNPDLLNQRLLVWGPATCVLTNSRGNFYGKLREKCWCCCTQVKCLSREYETQISKVQVNYISQQCLREMNKLTLLCLSLLPVIQAK